MLEQNASDRCSEILGPLLGHKRIVNQLGQFPAGALPWSRTGRFVARLFSRNWMVHSIRMWDAITVEIATRHRRSAENAHDGRLKLRIH